MQSELLGLLQREVARQATFAISAFADLEDAVARLEPPTTDSERAEFAAAKDKRQRREIMDRQFADHQAQARRAQHDVWRAIQSFLVFAGNVSKLMWGTSDQRAAERKPLRETLEVTDDSPLADRQLRNHLEHFDERLVAWVAEGHPVLADSNIIDSSIIREDSGYETSPLPRESLRVFDRHRFVVTFYDDVFELRPILAALAAVGRTAAPLWRAQLGQDY